MISAVSGGAYAAGAWATHDRARAESGNPDAEPEATAQPPDDTGSPRRPFAMGSPELRHVRNNSTYLAPGLAGKVRAFNEWGSGALVTITLYAASVFVAGWLLGWLAASIQPLEVFQGPEVLPAYNAAWWSVAIVSSAGDRHGLLARLQIRHRSLATVR